MTGIKALARHLDLSIGTVSRALNAKPDVSAATRDRVLAAARELGYRPNHSGRALRHGRTGTVGLVVETGSPTSLAGDAFFMQLTDAMQEVLAGAGTDLVLLPCRSADDPIEFLRRQVARRMVDALVITATRRQDPRIAMLLEEGMPFLALGRSETPGDWPWIDLDFDGVVRRAVTELAALGHRRIALVAPRRDVNLARLWTDGYRAAIREAGLVADEGLILRLSVSENGGRQAAEAVLGMKPRPTAILLVSEMLATGLYGRLAEAGLEVGRDLSVIGFRRNPQLGFLRPGLAGFALDLRALGEAVGRAALALSEPGGPADGVVWGMDWVPAPSVGPAPAG
ncbi:substrate-binding domain-containing protein [Wenxinia saemankumensis]|uniref:Transcriptional regulator, LacI family n=1 Tax=Wenxinia saemankumensis TaxID=1447782 RepID=A0A1M6ACU1_9RHOB|nr:substrate-binding domain-containing protein [Wenxinia saemankumensis]SHI34003.1 transcriptional regulator, LacI family [Wenxinia saemankumensis]